MDYIEFNRDWSFAILWQLSFRIFWQNFKATLSIVRLKNLQYYDVFNRGSAHQQLMHHMIDTRFRFADTKTK